MAVFEYKALDAKGKNVTGIIDSESAPMARQKLRASGIFPVDIKEAYGREADKETEGFSFSMPFRRVRQSEVTMMTRQLSTLIGAGFPLVSALYTLVPQAESQALKNILSKLKDSIEEGKSFAGALSIYPDIFSPIYINMVRAGESSGTLEIVLDRLADISEKQQSLNNKIKSVMAYPTIMAILGTAVLFFLLAFIVPRLTAIFADVNQALPLTTRILIEISDILKSSWWVLLLLMAGGVALLRYLKKTTKGRYTIDKIFLTLPLLGPLFKKLAVARFARTLGSLLENGVTMLSALDIVKNIVGNVIIADAVESAANEVEKGCGLGKALEADKVFPYLSVQMIQVGEQSGELENMLSKIADVFENEVESTMVSLTSLLEPLIILVMGIVVGFVVLSIVQPIMEMNQLVR